jgi:hypothetical protein
MQKIVVLLGKHDMRRKVRAQLLMLPMLITLTAMVEAEEVVVIEEVEEVEMEDERFVWMESRTLSLCHVL